MSTQRPFLSNFFAAFRFHAPQLTKAPASTSPSVVVASSATIWTSATGQKNSANVQEPAASSPRPINAKANPYSAQAAVAAAATAAQDRQLVASLSPLQHNVSPQTHLPRSSSASGLPVYGPPNKPQPSYPTCQDVRKSRRGSDSSHESGGFREVRNGNDKWFIGGLTAGGEEKYYKLSMIKRERSWDRISADQLSI